MGQHAADHETYRDADRVASAAVADALADRRKAMAGIFVPHVADAYEAGDAMEPLLERFAAMVTIDVTDEVAESLLAAATLIGVLQSVAELQAMALRKLGKEDPDVAALLAKARQRIEPVLDDAENVAAVVARLRDGCRAIAAGQEPVVPTP